MTAASSGTARQRLVTLATTVAFAAYLLLLHMLIVGGGMPGLTLLLVVAPWIVALFATLFTTLISSTIRQARPLQAALVVATLVAMAVVGLRYGQRLGAHAELLLYLENLGFMLALASLFASTLRADGEALITRLARTTRVGDMPPRVVAYTRRLTLVWAMFFVADAGVSSVFFFTQPHAVWSAFVNLATWPLVATLFVVEYAVRVRALRGLEPGSMMAGVQAFRRADRTSIPARSEAS